MKGLVRSLGAVVIGLMLFSGCATVLGGGNEQRIYLKSDLEGASFLIKDQTGKVVYYGKNPRVLTLSKKNTYTIEMSREGYATKKLEIHRGISGWFWGNILLGLGPVGMAIDSYTGSMWELQPTALSIKVQISMSETSQGYRVTFAIGDSRAIPRSVAVLMERI